MSAEAEKSGGGVGGAGAALRLGCRMPYRQLSSQIVSKDEIAEEIANRFSKSASETTRPFVDKRVLQEALLALKFDTQFIRKIDPSNEEVLRPKPIADGAAAANGEEEPRLRFGQRLDPKLEKELALKQLSELPTLKRRRKQQPQSQGDGTPASEQQEQQPNPVLFNEKVLQNLKRSVQRSARHSELVPGPEAVRNVLMKLEEGSGGGNAVAPPEDPFGRPATSRIIRRHSSSEDSDSEHEDQLITIPSPPKADQNNASPGECSPRRNRSRAPAQSPAEKVEGRFEGRVMRSRAQKTYPSKRRLVSSDGGEEGLAPARRTYPSPHVRKQLSR